MHADASVDPGVARRARRALLVAAGVYLGYAALGFVPGLESVRGVALLAGFYFLPQWILRDDPARAQAWQVGPDRPIPPWRWRGLKWAAIAMAVAFPPFVLGFLWFYARVCQGELDVLAPVLWFEQWTPVAGGIERYLERLCHGHNGAFWPTSWRLPEAWTQWGGLGGVYLVALEVFAVALPEEVFHRGYLMSALEERFPPRLRVLGVPFGFAAVASSLVFALGHLVGMAEAARLTTFFPALLFAWLWRKSDSLWAPALLHAASNVLMTLLIASTFPK